MIPPLDVFSVNDNETKWMGSAGTLSEAVELIRTSGTGSYFVFSQQTGRKKFFRVNSEGAVSPISEL